jgi:DNA-binding response OmpR family regulator
MPLSVLVVEDDKRLNQVLSAALRAAGYEVCQAYNVAEAVASCRDSAPGSLVLDINLPDDTGWELLRKLGRLGQPQPPTVVLTAIPPSAARIEEFGVSWLQKPFPIEALLEILDGRDRE